MEDKHDDIEDVDTASSDSFIDDSDEDNKPTISDENNELHVEANLTEEEIEELIAELMEVESKAAEAQESLEDESLRKVEDDVREELAQTLQGDDLEKSVAAEMESYREEWETVLDELETESSHLLEQLDGAGIELPSLYKWIDSQAPNVSSTEAWKKRTHWIGAKATNDVAEFVSGAENYLKIHRPVTKKHGKVLEEGASGYLEKKLAADTDASVQTTSVDWSSFNKLLSGHSSEDRASFGNKLWASVYLASTPQQAAEMGLDFPGMDEVEEIGDIEGDSNDPFMEDAVANEREPVLTEEQKKKFRKVKEEDDANFDKKLQLRLKHRRKRNINKQEAIWRGSSTTDRSTDGSSNGQMHPSSGGDGKVASGSSEDDSPYIKTVDNCSVESFDGLNKSAPLSNGTGDMVSNNGVPDESRGSKRVHDDDGSNIGVKKSRIVIIDSDDENHVAPDKATSLCPIPEMTGLSVHKSDGDGSIYSDHDPQKTVEAFHCTSCGIVPAELHSHPLLGVVICQDCKCHVEQKMHSKDLDFMEGYCAWCGGTQNLLTCISCKTLFCGTCIKRNFGEERLLQIQQSSWICCCCSPDMLKKLTSPIVNAVQSKSLTTSSSDSDSGTSVTEIKLRASSKRRRRKKKIRRILDDAELGEETKKKIAIEKERQERLKSLEAQFSRKSIPVDSKIFNCNFSEDSSAEVLGDASTGYIVNVVREKGEDAVRIPPSLSRKLKPHQIAGIRFMWENIIQSVTKVKSGDKGLGCILAHTMGLGKTFQVIAFLYTAMRSVELGLRTALIVTPVSVLHNWRKEFLKWGPSELKPLRIFMLEDVSRERRAELLAKWRRKGGIFLISYAAFRNLSLGKHVKDRQIASNICLALQDGPDILVCDEAHMIKNTRAETTQALKQSKCQRRIALTGSPLQNNLMEYYCMVDFVREGFLGSSHEFRNRFQNPIENGQHTNSTSEDVKIMNQSSHILYEQLKGFVQRMDMNVMKDDLPPKTVFVIAVKLAPLQRKLYKRFLDVHGFRNVQVASEKSQKRSFFAGYQALAQIWNHPGILQLMKHNRDYGKPEDAVDNVLQYDSFSDENMDCNMATEKQTTRELLQGKQGTSFFRENWWKDLLQENTYKEIGYSGKMVLLLDIITMSSDVGDKILVFSQSLSTLDLVEYHLSKLARNGKAGKFWKKRKDWYRLDGRTEALERQKLVEKFNDPSNKRVKCTLISTRAGSLGINLYAANRVVIVDGSWNPTYDLQAIYRAWRYGQTKPVFAYRLMAHGTMEEKIYKRQVTKEGLAARVVDRQQIYRTISKEEMLHLFDFGDDESAECYSEHGLENGDSGLPNGNVSSDKLMETLLSRHCPRWVVNYHEHETLLQENEDEKLSKEEQDMAWEVYRRHLEWEEARRLNPDNPAPNPWEEVKRVNLENAKPPPPVVPETVVPVKSWPVRDRSRDRITRRTCTDTAHFMTLRVYRTQPGGRAVCGECAKFISWEDFDRDKKKLSS
ncbi:protein CHROMATIN REMODELING 20 [Impatiens glandulifera]|uniref:protein CHROMATIN REMODELING 20 n=1 Tax=Impatiens glandulifera TaxID=253017 RepID=UPI001FB0A6F6|nr:protein CHROMATIN REMODELING 20 [Impatiens glandulifera]